MCSEAADSSGSPDLGPPPVSRFVDEDPPKQQSPNKSTEETVDQPPKPKNATNDTVTALPPPPKLDFAKKPGLDGETKQLIQESVPILTRRGADKRGRDEESEPTVVIPQALRVGSKRKFGDENDVGAIAKPSEKPTPLGTGNTEKDRRHSEIQKRRSFKALSAAGAEARGKPGNGLTPTGNPARRALAAKSTNDDVTSPMKPSRNETPAEAKPIKKQGLKKETIIERPSRRKEKEKETRPPPLDTAAAPEPEAPSSDPLPIPPTTPEPSQSTLREVPRDTPPPTDISSMGEASRPSRRVRNSVSYAEPNLRDKMRRPTKELLDAVTGEGRYIHKSGSSKPDDAGSASVPTSNSGSKPPTNWRNMPAAEALAKESARRQSALSPLAQKDLAGDVLPASVVSDRRKRPSVHGTTREPQNPSPDSSENDGKTSQDGPKTEAKEEKRDDVYDFTTSSPVSETKESREDEKDETITVRQPAKNTRRASSSSKSSITASETSSSPAKATKPSGSRKRASMAGPKRSSMLDLDEAEESLGDDESSAKGRVSRRRSMML